MKLNILLKINTLIRLTPSCGDLWFALEHNFDQKIISACDSFVEVTKKILPITLWYNIYNKTLGGRHLTFVRKSRKLLTKQQKNYLTKSLTWNRQRSSPFLIIYGLFLEDT